MHDFNNFTIKLPVLVDFRIFSSSLIYRVSTLCLVISEMVEKLTLKRDDPPEWLRGNIPSNNPNMVTLHGSGGQGVAVPVALLVADSQLAREMLHMCEGPEKHITIRVEVEIISLYVKLLSSGELKINNR